jgi:5-methylcytosine-specific restriction enzyme A
LVRNPAWTRDELILALDLYLRVNPLHTSEQNPEIQALSVALNELPVHAVRPDGASFRNPNGVYMKLCNFLRLDPGYEGAGLTRGNRLEEEVWGEFAGDPELLRATAAAILASKGAVSSAQVEAEVPSGDEEFPEGRVLTTLHKRRERNTAAVRRKKQSVLAATGSLACEVCNFDFESVYGELGRGFAECHHTMPLSELTATGATRLSDLAIVCANCHRMIHQSRPVMSVEELRDAMMQAGAVKVV